MNFLKIILDFLFGWLKKTPKIAPIPEPIDNVPYTPQSPAEVKIEPIPPVIVPIPNNGYPYFALLDQKSPYFIPNPSKGWAEYPADKIASLVSLARMTAKQYGLSNQLTAELLATIKGESGWNVFCVHDNGGSQDIGIIQANTFWYIGEGKPLASIAEALNNVEKCLSVMAKRFSEGGANDWIAHKSGGYKSYLSEYL